MNSNRLVECIKCTVNREAWLTRKENDLCFLHQQKIDLLSLVELRKTVNIFEVIQCCLSLSLSDR